jgi:HTH-type transcriptional regulator/antitoxin HigA
MNKGANVSANALLPHVFIHPGEIIRDEMHALKLSQKELAEKLNISESYMSEVLRGKKAITPHLAIALENVFETSAQFWMNLHTNYQIDLIKSGMKSQTA